MGGLTLLITGPGGQLGREICLRAAETGHRVIPAGRPGFDITDQDLVTEVIRESGASIVVNTAAYTAVDKAEDEPEKAFRVNRDGPAFLASACSRFDIPLIHISTDYVFDGTKDGPYAETDPVNPGNLYGMSKASGEAEVRDRLDRHIILRTSWLYGTHGHNFVKTMLGLGLEREEIKVVSDRFGCPTWAGELASKILKLTRTALTLKEPHWGTYHCCGSGSTSWHGFAEEIFRLARPFIQLKVKRVSPISSGDFPAGAARPRNSVMDCSAIDRDFGLSMKPWRETLASAIRWFR